MPLRDTRTAYRSLRDRSFSNGAPVRCYSAAFKARYTGLGALRRIFAPPNRHDCAAARKRLTARAKNCSFEQLQAGHLQNDGIGALGVVELPTNGF